MPRYLRRSRRVYRLESWNKRAKKSRNYDVAKVAMDTELRMTNGAKIGASNDSSQAEVDRSVECITVGRFEGHGGGEGHVRCVQLEQRDGGGHFLQAAGP